ncbi:GH25 family lysozyme [Streptomyces sp. NPDC005438]|uniref:GH25 family lysozyme n=1 Tax=Streptomyces sp. NPDC005438 TaxID=3156880 RepID=UPI0033B9FA01
MSPRRAPSPRRRRLVSAGVLGACLTLAAGATGYASQGSPADPPQDGPGYMGISQDAARPAAGGGGVHAAGSSGGVQGVDVSHWQGSITWSKVRKAGIRFAWIKATEGSDYRDSRFAGNYKKSHKAGLYRGAYHFARPNSSSGAQQAKFFAKNGGHWSKNSRTLPGVLDIEANPGGATCYGKSASAMRKWIKSFHSTYRKQTGRALVVYTNPAWWNQCTGGWSGLKGKAPLWVAHWNNSGPSLPGGFSTWRVWQYTDSGKVNGISGNTDRNKLNGKVAQLKKLANS